MCATRQSPADLGFKSDEILANRRITDRHEIRGGRERAHDARAHLDTLVVHRLDRSVGRDVAGGGGSRSAVHMSVGEGIYA